LTILYVRPSLSNTSRPSPIFIDPSDTRYLISTFGGTATLVAAELCALGARADAANNSSVIRKRLTLPPDKARRRWTACDGRAAPRACRRSTVALRGTIARPEGISGVPEPAHARPSSTRCRRTTLAPLPE